MKISIADYKPDLKQYFYDINHEWISNMFEMEEIDKYVLKNPQETILKSGGYIWFASLEGMGTVGACALKQSSPGVFELTKMAVFEKARGHKVGEHLLQHVIEFAQKASHIKSCYLISNPKCQAAIHLYEKHGFVHDADILKTFGDDYDRGTVGMRLF